MWEGDAGDSSLVEVGLKDGFGKSKGITLLLELSTGLEI